MVWCKGQFFPRKFVSFDMNALCSATITSTIEIICVENHVFFIDNTYDIYAIYYITITLYEMKSIVGNKEKNALVSRKYA